MEDLWDADTGRLRIELLAGGEPDEYKRYRSCLTRHKDAFYADLTRAVAGTSSYVLTDQGVVKAFKSQITNARWIVFKDALVVQSSVKLAEFERSMRLRHPIFVMSFIISPSPCNLPLGMFVVERLSEDKKSWHLQRHEDVAVWLPVPSLQAGGEAVDVSEPDDAAACEPPTGAPPVASEPSAAVQRPPQLPATSAQNEPRRVVPPRGRPALRFSHNSDDFDSLLECIHREAFRRLGLRYLVTRNTFQLGHLLTEQSQKLYTTDGILYAAVGAPAAPLQVFHVEIKPGPLSVEEGERCKALCQFLNQNVLCVCGGNVSDAQFAEETAAAQGGAAVDYAVRPRHRCCVEMSAYMAQGVDAPPLYCHAVAWHFADGPCVAPFLSACHAADPRRWDETRLRLLRVYHLATKDANRFARGPEPY